MAAIDRLLQDMVAHHASDLHLSTGLKPFVRVHGAIQELDASAEPLTSSFIEGLLREIMHPEVWQQLQQERDTDCAYELPGFGRFRVNGFFDMHGAGAVLRQIPEVVPTFDELGLPVVLRDFCSLSKGLVVVTGPTGSGKSTTLAAMIGWINKTQAAHIISIEDPIEFVHHSERCLINQREVHRNTSGFARALRAALREDPDIVLVGEMRDLETMEIAIEMAETGHLVLATLHTNTAATTVDRIIDKFPGSRQSQIRSMLGDALKGVVAQTLCRRIGGGRIAAFEVLVVNVPVASHIREGKTHMIPTVMQTSRSIGMQTFSEALTKLVIKGKITAEEAYFKAVDKDEIRVALGNAGASMAFLDDASHLDETGRLLMAQKRETELRARVAAAPDNVAALNDLAWLLATSPFDGLRNGREALQLSEHARDLTRGKDPIVLDTLGAAQAETRHFSRAIATTREAIDLLLERRNADMVGALSMRIKTYQKELPFRDL